MYTNQDYGRLSLNKALTKGDYIGAFEKVNDYLKMINDRYRNISNKSVHIKN